MLALRPSCRMFVQEDWHAELCPDFVGDLIRQAGAIFQRDARDRNKWNDVCRSDTGMDSLVTIQVNQFHCSRNPLEGGSYNALGGARKRDHATVVVRIHGAVQY